MFLRLCVGIVAPVADVILAATDFFQDVEVLVDIFERAVVG